MFGRKRVVGLEVDEGEIRAVELEKKGKVNKLVNWGRISLPPDTVKDGIILEVDVVSKALSDLWIQSNFKNKDVVIGVSNQGVIVRFIDVPMMPMDKLDQFLSFQGQDYLPVPMETLVFDYSVVGEILEGDRKNLTLLIVGAKKEMIDSYVRALHGAGLEPLDILVSPLALMGLLDDKDHKKIVTIVDIAYGISNIVISEKGVPKLARIMQPSIANVAAVSARSVDESPFNGRKLSREAVGIWSEVLAEDIYTSIGYYLAQKGSKDIDKIVLSGKGATLKGLSDNLEKMLNIPVEIVKPYNKIDVIRKSLEPMGDKSLDFALSISLALRGLEVKY